MLEWMKEILNSFGSFLMSVLPTSPFQQFISDFSNLPYLGWLNWFIPIGSFIKIGTAWLTAVGVFYLYSVIMRWVKMIGD